MSALLDAAVEGDSAALKQLLRQFGPAARGAVRGRVPAKWSSVLEEDDVMQVVYLEAFLHLEQLEARDAPGFAAWLRRIAENTLRNAIRELERQKRPDPSRRIHAIVGAGSEIALLQSLARTSETPSRAVGRSEARHVLHAALSELPRDYATALRLVDLEGLSVPEAAEEMGRSVGAVHMLRARARERLRALLGTPSRFFSDPA